ncbi:hypothetical protein [Loigolactobacillus zhaoyuanensis]|uniref:DUF3784 domain-containing protein n=1 Tax=Loigolactobacillus zhaoyuanensis TaxID=2486017 RepID=A0ABW8UBB3_9LACO|nr:hypothetical protein [Loigolactobacillus zhaoyuanensis]
MRIMMLVFALVLFGISYYLHRQLNGRFLNHQPQKEPQLKSFLTNYRNYFAIIGGLTCISMLTSNVTFWLVCLLMGCILAAVFAVSFANQI